MQLALPGNECEDQSVLQSEPKSRRLCRGLAELHRKPMLIELSDSGIPALVAALSWRRSQRVPLPPPSRSQRSDASTRLTVRARAGLAAATSWLRFPPPPFISAATWPHPHAGGAGLPGAQIRGTQPGGGSARCPADLSPEAQRVARARNRVDVFVLVPFCSSMRRLICRSFGSEKKDSPRRC